MDTPADPALEFRSVFPAEGRNPYNAVQVGRIHDHRANLDGELFFDNILTAFAKVSDGASTIPLGPLPLTAPSLQPLPSALHKIPPVPPRSDHHLPPPRQH